MSLNEGRLQNIMSSCHMPLISIAVCQLAMQLWLAAQLIWQFGRSDIDIAFVISAVLFNGSVSNLAMKWR